LEATRPDLFDSEVGVTLIEILFLLEVGLNSLVYLYLSAADEPRSNGDLL
jgi:hypothetical protein